MPETKIETNEKKDIPVEAIKNSPYIKNDKKNDTEKNSMLFYILTIFSAFLLVGLIIGGLLFFAVKNNVNGIADSMGDSIEKIPIIRLALPEKPDIEDEKNMTEEEVRIKYSKLREEKASMDKQISDLNSQLEKLNKQVASKDTNSSLLQQQKAALEKEKLALMSQNEILKKDFENISAAIAKGDTTEFKKYFEKIDQKAAAQIYSEILKDEKISDDVKKYCSIYEEMDASAVAGILEQMGTGKMSLIIEIMKNLKKDTSAEILTNMNAEFAAKVSEQLAKEYNVTSTKTK